MGLQVREENGVVTLNGSAIDKLEAPYDDGQNHACFDFGWVLCWRVLVKPKYRCRRLRDWSAPGRSTYQRFGAMGAEITIEAGYIHAKAKRLRGARIVTDMITVTGTENLLMAATLADGETIWKTRRVSQRSQIWRICW